MGIASIAPHGGKLIDRELEGKAAEEAKLRAQGLIALSLSDRELCDLEMIASGAMSPLEGFMNHTDYETCLSRKRLSNGLPWTIPVTKSITDDEKSKISKAREVALTDSQGRKLAILEVVNIFPHDRARQAMEIYRTEDEAHP